MSAGERSNDRETVGPVDWSLDPTSADERDILDRLLQLYPYDFSVIDPDDVGPDGRFPYRWHDRYWTDPTRHALLLRVLGRLAGFALVRAAGAPDLPDPACHDLAEFFVVRVHRRAGYGSAMASALFDRFPGEWWIEQIGPNLVARAFWRRVVASYTGGRYAEHVTTDGAVIQRFHTEAKVIR